MGAWFIAVRKILEIFSEMGGQNSKQFARNDHWMTFKKKIAKTNLIDPKTWLQWGLASFPYVPISCE